MSTFMRVKRREMEDVEPSMVPIMNMFLVLIPFLLMSASFYHIKAVNTSIPVLAESNDKADKDAAISLCVIVELKKDSLKLTAMNDELSRDQLKNFEVIFSKDSQDAYPLERLSSHLQKIKNQYPESDTLILIPDNSTNYNTIIRTMDIARKTDETTLFPNVVLSGAIG